MSPHKFVTVAAIATVPTVLILSAIFGLTAKFYEDRKQKEKAGTGTNETEQAVVHSLSNNVSGNIVSNSLVGPTRGFVIGTGDYPPTFVEGNKIALSVDQTKLIQGLRKTLRKGYEIGYMSKAAGLSFEDGEKTLDQVLDNAVNVIYAK